MESLKHWELLAKQCSVTSQNTWIFSSLSLREHNTMFCHSVIGNRGDENYCKATFLSLTLCSYGYNMHEYLSISQTNSLLLLCGTCSIHWKSLHWQKNLGMPQLYWSYFHSLLLFCIVMHQHRPWTTSPLKSYRTKLRFTDGQGIHTLRSIQEISKDQYFGGLKEHTYFLYTWRLS